MIESEIKKDEPIDYRDAVIAKLSVENEKLRSDLVTLYTHCKDISKAAVELGRMSDMYDVSLKTRGW
jgi:hypothetical protein